MVTKSSRKWLIVAGILLLFIVTNPSPSTFKEYAGLRPTDYESVERKANFYIFSIYKYSGGTYFGLLGNFVHKETGQSKESTTSNTYYPESDDRYLYVDTSKVSNNDKIDSIANSKIKQIEKTKRRKPTIKELMRISAESATEYNKIH